MIVSRNIELIEIGVVSVILVYGGIVFNVIFEEVEFKGIFCFFKFEVGELI